MILQDTELLITFGDLSMRHDKLDIDQFPRQLVLDPSAISGWLDGPGTRRDVTPRLAGDGDFYEPAFNSARLITITGTAIAKTPQDLQILRDQLMGQCPNGAYTELRVRTSTSLRYSTVGFEGTPSWVQQLDTVASFKIDLYAPDPRVYGAWQRFTLSQGGGTAGGLNYALKYPLNYYRPASDYGSSVTNNGNTTAYPQFEVAGSYTQGFTISDNRNARVTFAGIVTAQAPVIVDMARGSATQNGVDKSTLLTVRDWITVKPGETLSPSFQPLKDGSGYCAIMFRDTWI